MPPGWHLVPDVGADEKYGDEYAHGYGHALDGSVPKQGESLPEAELGDIFGDSLCEAARPSEAPKGHDDRGKTEVADEDSVEQTPTCAHEQSDCDRRREREPDDLRHLPEHGGGEHRYRSHGKIDISRQHEHRPRDSNEADYRHLKKNGEQVRPREKLAAGGGEDGAHD